MERAIADLEEIRDAAGVTDWVVLGHSWGSDLAVRYAVEYPSVVRGVVGIAGKGAHRDRTWSEIYEAGKSREPIVDIELAEEVWSSLSRSFTEWIHQPGLWRGLADCPIPMHFIAAGDDIRPSWPLQQLATLVPNGKFSVVPDVPHDFWFTDPHVWVRTVTSACAAVAPQGQ